MLTKLNDLAICAFCILRNSFFDAEGNPVPFKLHKKGDTQDDPFDKHVKHVLSKGLRANRTDALCEDGSGPLISPDCVLWRRKHCITANRAQLEVDTSLIMGLEIKKVQRTAKGTIARRSSLDYNSTPPCGTIEIVDGDGRPLKIRCFYLFACLEPWGDGGQVAVTAMVLCDGDLINSDFALYKEITSQRDKVIGLGSYGDGANRKRPMMIFANPLGARELDRSATLILANDMEQTGFTSVHRITRTTTTGETKCMSPVKWCKWST